MAHLSFPGNLLSPDRIPLSKSYSTPLGKDNFAFGNLVMTTSSSTGELNMATSEAIKSIHDEMDLLVREGKKLTFIALCTHSNSKLTSRLKKCCSQLEGDETLRTVIISGQNVRKSELNRPHTS